LINSLDKAPLIVKKYQNYGSIDLIEVEYLLSAEAGWEG
jgi:hypothetical protein